MAGNHASVYGRSGERKYLNAEERQRILTAVEELPPDRAVFIQLLAWSGARVSELLALTPHAFQLDAGVVAVRTLKRRTACVREIPIPPGLMAEIDSVFRMSALQAEGCTVPVFGWSRATAWRMVRGVCLELGIIGQRACPRGLRHGYGVGTLQSGVPLNLIQRWLGHARMETTAIYAGVSGPEEHRFAALFWDDRIGRSCRAACSRFAEANRPRAPAPSKPRPPSAARHTATLCVRLLKTPAPARVAHRRAATFATTKTHAVPAA